jgi:hypothetical protein
MIPLSSDAVKNHVDALRRDEDSGWVHSVGSDESGRAISPGRIWHLSDMEIKPKAIALRSPADPSPPPIKEPPDPPENPDAPVREPDPTEPAQISNLRRFFEVSA